MKENPNDGTVQEIDYLRDKFILLVQGVLPRKKEHKHCHNIYEWLNTEKELNVNNFSQSERENLHAIVFQP